MSKNQLDATNTLWEYLLIRYGYCPGPEHLQGEQCYHAIFHPAFHRSCFLSVHLTSADNEAILTFGYLAHPWEWKSYAKILAYIRETHHDLTHAEDISVYGIFLRREEIKEIHGFPPLPEQESLYIQNVHMATIPLEAVQQFRQQMREAQPLELETLMLEPQQARDGIAARGIVADKHCSHRFDIWPAPLTNRHTAYFQACLSVGNACLEGAAQEQLKAIQRYLV